MKPSYLGDDYMRRERLLAYVDQITVTRDWSLPSDTILEIGKGNGYFSDFMKRYLGRPIITLDYDQSLNPDIVANIVSSDFLLPQKFEVATCFEVLEHIPFEKLPRIIENILTYIRKVMIISVPNTNFFIQLRLNYLFLRYAPYCLTLSFTRFFKYEKTLGKGHYWEIGMKTRKIRITPKIVIEEVFGGRQNVICYFRGREFPGYHYFILKGRG